MFSQKKVCYASESNNQEMIDVNKFFLLLLLEYQIN
jgi:hypothetical protein